MTRQDLIAAVLADPDALWAVLTAGVKVVGAWETVNLRAGSIRQRRGVNGAAAVFAYERDGAVFVCRGDFPVPFSGTLTEAEAWLDQKLTEAGWLLATAQT